MFGMTRFRAAWRGIALLVSLVLLGLGVAAQHDKVRPIQLKPRVGDPTYLKDIEPLFAVKCLSCHVPDGHGPFSLVTYQDVRKRAHLVRNIVMIRAMPPTDAISDHGPIASQEPLTDDEIVTIQEWVRLGMPEGDPKDAMPKLEPRPAWPLGKPDLVLRIPRPRAVQREGVAYWRAYTVPAGLAFGKRLRAMDVRPKSPKAVRQVVVTLDPSEAVRKRDRGEGFDTFGSLRPYLGTSELPIVGTWAPGNPPWYPRMAPISIDARNLAVQVLYQPTGRAEDANVEIGLYFTSEPDSGAQWVSLIRPSYTIAPDDNPTLTETLKIERDSLLYGLYPEARSYCKQITVTLMPPEGEPSRLLFVYTWDPTWPGSYLLPYPVGLPKESIIRAEFTYDNSKHRTQKLGGLPDPVSFGNARDREMMALALLIGPVVAER